MFPSAPVLSGLVNRLGMAAVAALMIASVSACGSQSSPSKTSGGSSAKVITPTPSKDSLPAPLLFNAGGYLAGNAKPELPAGEPGKVTVVAEAPLHKDGIGAATLPVVYRNNTSKAISHVDLSATARLNGDLVASGQSQGSTPAQVKPGEVGMAFIYFEDAKSLPDSGLTYEFSFDTTAADTSSYNTAPLTVKEATLNGKSIVGTALNATGKALTGPYDVQVYCFNGNNLVSQTGTFADRDGDIAADESVSFTASLNGAKCPTFAVGVSGFFQ